MEISHPEEAVELGYQQTADAGIGVYGNYYFMGSDQKIDEQVGNNIIMRFQYADKLSFLQKAVILFVIALAAGFPCCLWKIMREKKNYQGCEGTVGI